MRPSPRLAIALLWPAALLCLGGAPRPLSAQHATGTHAPAEKHGSPPAAAPSTRQATVVLLVRHAEKAPAPADDPPLSEAGSVRARALAAALADAGVDAIVVTPRLRTRATAQPLADARGLQPEEVALAGGAAAHAQAVAAAVRRHAGGVVLVVGHSNTIPAIVAALGGPSFPDLCDGEYSNLYMLVLEPGSPTGDPAAGPAAPATTAAHLVRSHYGQADDPAALRACAAMTPR